MGEGWSTDVQDTLALRATDRSAMKPSNAPVALPRVAHHETLQTINVVLQQAGLMAVRGALPSAPKANTFRSGRYLQSLARKATLRLDPSIKRSICRGCRAVMLPGLSAATRIRPSRSADLVIVTRCHACNTLHRLPCPSRHDKRFKVLTRRRRKEAEAKDVRRVAKKASDFYGACNVTRTMPMMVVAAPEEKSARLSQRSRRRAGRAKARRMRGLNSSALTTPSKKARRRKKRGAASIAEGGHDQQSLTKGATSSNVRIMHSDAKPSKQRKGRRRAVRLDLPRYCDRDERQDALSWKQDLPKELNEEQKEALSVFRGDHILSVGLGKGGTIVRAVDM